MRRSASALPSIHEALVARLEADLRPVRRLWSPWARLGAWLALAVAVTIMAAAVGLRTDLASAIRRPVYDLEIAALLGAASAAALLALYAAVPGRSGGRRAARVAYAFGVVASGALVAEHVAAAPSLLPFVESGLRCTACIAMFGALPWAALLVAVRRAAPLDGRAVATSVGAAGFLTGAAAVRVACPIDDPVHLLAWHMLPVALWTGLSAIASAAWLVRWRSAARVRTA